MRQYKNKIPVIVCLEIHLSLMHIIFGLRIEESSLVVNTYIYFS